MKTKEDILKLISEVKHPAINYSLVDLGIVKDIQIKENLVTLIFAFPFPNIPIADALINSIKTPLNNINFDLEYQIIVMTEEEKAIFMKKEAEAWIG